MKFAIRRLSFWERVRILVLGAFRRPPAARLVDMAKPETIEPQGWRACFRVKSERLDLEAIGEKIATHRTVCADSTQLAGWCCEVGSGEIAEQLFAEVHRLYGEKRNTAEEALRDVRLKTEAKYADELSTLTLPERKDAF